MRWKLKAQPNFVKMFRIICWSKLSDDSVLIPLYPPRKMQLTPFRNNAPTYSSNFSNQKLSSALWNLPITNYNLRLFLLLPRSVSIDWIGYRLDLQNLSLGPNICFPIIVSILLVTFTFRKNIFKKNLSQN